MNADIPGVDRGHVAEWAIAQMYRAMRLAEKSAGDYAHNKGLIANSNMGARDIPTQADLDTLAGDNKWYMQQAQMYAAIFVTFELADESPHRDKYQAAITAAGASLGGKQIPRQRVPAEN